MLSIIDNTLEKLAYCSLQRFTQDMLWHTNLLARH